MVPFRNFLYNLYFINLGQVKWTFCQESIGFAGKKIAGIESFYPLDKIHSLATFRDEVRARTPSITRALKNPPVDAPCDPTDR